MRFLLEMAMKTVTLQVVEGVDKGRVYRDLAIPVTIGREEGNLLRLNDERVSRFHAKIQFDNDDVILTDLDSTNGTRINGNPIQIRRLRPGDRVGVGRSILIFGSNAEIAARIAADKAVLDPASPPPSKTLNDRTEASLPESFGVRDDDDDRFWAASDNLLPELPRKLSPSQSARFAEVLDFLHRGLASAIETVRFGDENRDVMIPFAEWQKIQAVQMLLARYLRSVSEPDVKVE
jgi:pSer/pThr/pTyr-binding forkhead associated (FHA) protein